jgi:type II secretory pathway pseudopilin PulG
MNRSTRQHVRAFTLLEVLASVFVIILLVGLLLFGVNRAITFAKRSGERQALTTMSIAITAFKDQFGFVPPLVKDVEAVTVRGGRTVISVYQPSDPDDRLFLRTQQNPPEATDSNPFDDTRYSEFSLGFYLSGSCEAKLLSTSSSTIPVDGVPGLGFMTPNADGSFDLPADYYRVTNDGVTRRLTGGKTESLLDLSGKAIKLAPFKVTGRDEPFSKLVDAQDVPYRFYRWIQGKPSVTNPAQLVVESVFDYNIPSLVGYTIDPTLNPDMKIDPQFSLEEGVKLRSATWAIVGAGPNKAFGDESPAVLSQLLGATLPTNRAAERILRARAAADNVVEVGE